MTLKEYIPTDSLKPFIKSYRIIESEDGQVNRVLPNTSFALAFCVRGQVSYVNDNSKIILPAITFSGLRKSVRLIGYEPKTTTIVVLFNEIGVSSIFGNGIHELYEQSVSLDNYFSKSEIEIIEERLENAENNVRRIELIERFLLSKLSHSKMDAIVSESIAKIHSANGNMRIKELIDIFGISQDAFEKRFRRATGATPKQFSHIVRMNSVIRQYRTKRLFLDLTFDNGYYDQPHFNKYFKIYTGETPTNFFRSTSYW